MSVGDGFADADDAEAGADWPVAGRNAVGAEVGGDGLADAYGGGSAGRRGALTADADGDEFEGDEFGGGRADRSVAGRGRQPADGHGEARALASRSAGVEFSRSTETEVGGAGGADAGGESVARRIALDALSRAARTRGQLEALLQRKGVAPEAAASVLDRFEEVGLIDDRDYAEAFVESRHRVRGQGGRVLSAELRRRGVAADVVADAVGGLDPDREFETACRIARSRYERMPAVAREVKVRRLVGFLARKGYSGAVVTRVVREVVEAAEAAGAEAMETMESLDGMGDGESWADED